ncbi:MAG: hypothetical protein LBM00_03260 [Deltaproteobacteria bacterium]|nr:hypothetical protein [Deltaproteobacteria bacterium]
MIACRGIAMGKLPVLIGLIFLTAAGSCLTGCAWIGRVAGKADAKIERKIDSVEQGYEEGYAQEKAKTAAPAK